MKKIILVAACIGALSAFATPGAFAQGTGRPAKAHEVSLAGHREREARVSFADDLKAKARA